MLCLLLNASAIDLLTKYKLFFRIQLAINVQIPVEYGGLGGKAVYLDTEGSFMVERVYQIAEGCISDILEHFPHSHEKSSSGQKQLQPEHFLADIYYFRICSYTEQIAAINYLEKFLGEHKDVRIVIIDSVTFHFRQDFDDMALRTRVLSGLSLKLMKIAKTYNLAVICLSCLCRACTCDAATTVMFLFSKKHILYRFSVLPPSQNITRFSFVLSQTSLALTKFIEK